MINKLVLLVLCKGFQRSHLKIVNVDVDVDVVVVLCVYRNWSSKSKILHCLASSIFINIGCVFWVCLGRAEGGREAWMRKRKEVIPFHSIASFFSIVHSFNYDSSRRKKKEFRCRSRANIMKYSILGKSASMAYMVAHTHRF